MHNEPLPWLPMMKPFPVAKGFVVAALLTFSTAHAGTAESRSIVVTAYDASGADNGYSRGNWMFLKVDQWNKYYNYGSLKGQRYTGKTANGGKLVQPQPGLFSSDSAKRPWMIPVRVVGAPFLAMPKDGTIAADTDYYPFGTRMYVPGWGWGTVRDRGGAIKGPDRIDIFIRSSRKTSQWGRQRLEVTIQRP